MIPARLTRRLGLPDGAAPVTRRFRLQGAPARFGVIGSTALIALMIAVSPAKPTVPREDAPPPAATQQAPETRKDGPAPSRPVRTVTKLAALEAEPLACPRVRRKLWVEGEGWVVRSVSRC